MQRGLTRIRSKYFLSHCVWQNLSRIEHFERIRPEKKILRKKVLLLHLWTKLWQNKPPLSIKAPISTWSRSPELKVQLWKTAVNRDSFESCVDPFSGLPREKKRKRRNFYSSLKFVEENSVSYLPTILIHLSFDFYSQRLVLKIRKEEKRISYRSSSNTSRNDAVWISFKWTRYRFSQISQLY